MHGDKRAEESSTLREGHHEGTQSRAGSPLPPVRVVDDDVKQLVDPEPTKAVEDEE